MSQEGGPYGRAGVSGGKVSVRTATRTLGLAGSAVAQGSRGDGNVPLLYWPMQQPLVTVAN